MRFLLDAHVLIWFFNKNPVLSAEARAQIIDPANTKFFSIASVWEMSIKAGLGKLTLAVPIIDMLAEFQKAGGLILPISLHHTLSVATLPWHHKDPFDRMLIAQTICDDLILISHDSLFTKYQLKILW